MGTIIQDLLKPLEALLLQLYNILIKALETNWLLSIKTYWNH